MSSCKKQPKNKLKTRSICKGKFKITGTGKLKVKSIGKRHLMNRKSSRQNRDNIKSMILHRSTSKVVLKKFLSYFKKLRKTL